jgi:hypothetical protein
MVIEFMSWLFKMLGDCPELLFLKRITGALAPFGYLAQSQPHINVLVSGKFNSMAKMHLCQHEPLSPCQII